MAYRTLNISARRYAMFVWLQDLAYSLLQYWGLFYPSFFIVVSFPTFLFCFVATDPLSDMEVLCWIQGYWYYHDGVHTSLHVFFFLIVILHILYSVMM